MMHVSPIQLPALLFKAAGTSEFVQATDQFLDQLRDPQSGVR
jgi:hypothetical protein